MNTALLVWNTCFFVWVCLMLYGAGIRIRKVENRLAEVERKQGEGSKIPDEAVARLSDPSALDAELERAGQLSDMRRARRAHLIRENAGPPAKVRKIMIRRK